MTRVSIGTAGVLGLADVPMAVAPTTAYLMVGERCSMNCAFCAQARESAASEGALSRVTWPEFALDKVCSRLGEAERRGDIRRCCIQVTSSKGHLTETLRTVRLIRETISLPLDVAILPTDMQEVEALIEAKVDHVGFGLDAACERVFRQVKGPHWHRVLSLLEGTARRFPGHATMHLIVGLGETEREMVGRILWAEGLEVETGLFAFTPLRGTPLEDRAPPPLGRYRRMQAARYLVRHYGARVADFAFAERRGQPDVLVGIRLANWGQYLADGSAFRTSGCADCNRPFYNERPGGTLYNYARSPTESEARRALVEMDLLDMANGPAA